MLHTHGHTNDLDIEYYRSLNSQDVKSQCIPHFRLSVLFPRNPLSDTMVSPDFYNISGFVFGAVGIIGTFQVICIIVYYYLPKRRLDALEKLFAQAYSLFRCGVEEGLLAPDEVDRIEEQLRWARGGINDSQNKAVCLGSFWRQLLAIFGPLSGKLRALEITLKRLHVVIATSSQKGRRELEERGRPYYPCMLPYGSGTPAFFCTPNQAIIARAPDESSTPQMPVDTTPSPSSDVLSSLVHASPRTTPTHRDTLCSISTTATAVEIDLPQPNNLQTAPTSDDSGETSDSNTNTQAKEKHTRLMTDERIDPNIVITNYYNDIQRHTEILLSKIRHLPLLRQQIEGRGYDSSEMDISDGIEQLTKLESYLSKIPQAWTGSSPGTILPL